MEPDPSENGTTETTEEPFGDYEDCPQLEEMFPDDEELIPSDDGHEGSLPRSDNTGRTEEQSVEDEIPDPSNVSQSTDTTLKSTTDGPPRIQLVSEDAKDEVAIKPGYDSSVSADEIEEKFTNMLGTNSRQRAFELLYRLLDFTDFIDGLNRREMVINRMLAQLDDMDVQSEIEAIQSVQLLIADEIQQHAAHKGMLADHLEMKEFYLEWAQRFMEQTNAKLESLKELTDEPEQTIRVEQVDVGDGGQAMVGNFRKNDQGGER